VYGGREGYMSRSTGFDFMGNEDGGRERGERDSSHGLSPWNRLSSHLISFFISPLYFPPPKEDP
jgi:hypothetical protein